jgi:hypothetical protein
MNFCFAQRRWSIPAHRVATLAATALPTFAAAEGRQK